MTTPNNQTDNTAMAGSSPPPCYASLCWHPGPAKGGGGTAQDEMPVGHGYSSWWADGDLLLVVVETASGPLVRLVHVCADGNMLEFRDPDTDDDNLGYTDIDIAWWAKIEESLPHNAQGEAQPPAKNL